MQKQLAIALAQVADLGEHLDSARAATASTDGDLQRALSEVTAGRAVLAEAQREVQALQQQARQAEQSHQAQVGAAQRAALELKERYLQER